MDTLTGMLQSDAYGRVKLSVTIADAKCARDRRSSHERYPVIH
ncbi:hypothetical protein PBI_MANDA_131 [Mycobacterium phage Manda]|nr:hypothetical protein PBI_MANDA_131 [Mycobacterium phage Manda]